MLAVISMIKKTFIFTFFVFTASFFLLSYNAVAIGVGGNVGCNGVKDMQTCTYITDTRGVPYMCQKVSIDPDPEKFACRAQNRAQAGIPPIIFESPTGTATFADLICRVTGFISDTILPPLAVLMTLVVGFLFLTSGGAPQRAGLAQKALLFTIAGVALLVLAPGIVVLIGDLFGDSAFKASLQASPGCQPVTTGTIVGALLKTVNWFSWLVAITSVAMGLYSGFLYITARDNPQQVQQAAKALSYVIIGIAVSVLAFSIVTITKQLMGL